MAVNVTSEPLEYTPSNNTFAWSLSMSDGGSGNTIKSLGFQLFKDDGSEVTPKISYPFKSSSFDLSFTDDVSTLVFSTAPIIGFTGISTDENIMASFYLDYGTFDFDKDTCQSTDNINERTETKTIINAALSPYEADIFNQNNVVVMSNRPNIFSLCENQSDWLYVFAKTSTTILMKTPEREDPLGHQNLTTGKVNIIPIGFENGYFQNLNVSSVPYITLEIHNNGQIVKEYRIKKECCSGGGDNFKEVIFLENLGGYSSLKFDEFDYSGQRDMSQTCITKPNVSSINYVELGQRYGKRNTKNKGGGLLTLRKWVDYDSSFIPFFDAFFASSVHLTRQKVGVGSTVPVNIYLENGSYDIINEGKTIELTATFSTDKNNSIPFG